jgi:hypothetical protein
MYYQYIQSIFCSMQDAHTLHMDFNNFVFVQIEFKFFTSKYLYIHSIPIPMAYIHGG